jgi:curved DNA-binding protein CbpA
MQPCPWSVLGVTRGASQAVIKAAYRRAALRCHPDRHRASAPAEALAAASRWREVSDAYARICSTGEARAVARRAGGVRQGAHFHRGGRQADASQGGDVRLLALMLTSGAVFMAAPVRRTQFPDACLRADHSRPRNRADFQCERSHPAVLSLQRRAPLGQAAAR